MSFSTDGDNLIISTRSNAISIICGSTNTTVTNMSAPTGFLIPPTAITPASDAKIGMIGTVYSTNGTIVTNVIKDLGATYTFTSPGVYLINLYLSITATGTTAITITNCGLGVSTSNTAFSGGTGQINCYNLASVTNAIFTATLQKTITVGANLQHYFIVNINYNANSFTYANNGCYWSYIKIG